MCFACYRFRMCFVTDPWHQVQRREKERPYATDPNPTIPNRGPTSMRPTQSLTPLRSKQTMRAARSGVGLRHIPPECSWSTCIGSSPESCPIPPYAHAYDLSTSRDCPCTLSGLLLQLRERSLLFPLLVPDRSGVGVARDRSHRSHVQFVIENDIQSGLDLLQATVFPSFCKARHVTTQNSLGQQLRLGEGSFGSIAVEYITPRSRCPEDVLMPAGNEMRRRGGRLGTGQACLAPKVWPKLLGKDRNCKECFYLRFVVRVCKIV